MNYINYILLCMGSKFPLRTLIVWMAAHDLNKVENYEITHVCLDLLGSWNCDTIHKCTHSRRRTRTNRYKDYTDQHWHQS